jgi:hypothetical protein
MSTKLDPGTLRALIGDAQREHDRWASGYPRYWWEKFGWWLQDKLELPKEQTATQQSIQPETDFANVPKPAPRMTVELANALAAWREAYRAQTTHVERLALAGAYDAAKERGEI